MPPCRNIADVKLKKKKQTLKVAIHKKDVL